eukprot:scaffold1949_cov348-Pavlova_lutheri.AAC.23
MAYSTAMALAKSTMASPENLPLRRRRTTSTTSTPRKNSATSTSSAWKGSPLTRSAGNACIMAGAGAAGGAPYGAAMGHGGGAP